MARRQQLKQLAQVTSSVVDVETRKVSNVVDPADDQDAATKNYVDSEVASPTTLDKARNPLASSGDGSSTGLAITATPAHDSHVVVDINGLSYPAGDGTKLKECYFSGDAGATAKNIADIVAGDVLYWNGVIAEVDLEATWDVDFHYVVASGTTAEALPTDIFSSASVVNMTIADRYYYGDTTSNAQSFNLPAISSATRGMIFDIKLVTKGASNLTVFPNGSDTIDEAASLVISTEKVSYTLRCPSQGTDWMAH